MFSTADCWTEWRTDACNLEVKSQMYRMAILLLSSEQKKHVPTHLGIDTAFKDCMLSEGHRPEVGQEQLSPHPAAHFLEPCKHHFPPLLVSLNS